MNEIPQEPVSQEPVTSEPVMLEKKSYLQRVFGMFTNPKSVFEYINEKPDLILSLLIPVIATILIMISGAIIGFRSPEALERMKNFSESTSMMVKYGATIVMSIFAVIFAVIFILIQAGIIHVIAPFLNGKGNFKSLVCVLAYSSAPMLIFGLISLAYIFLNPNVYIPFTASLGMIYTAEKVGFMWNAFYQNFDLFRFWSMGLTIVGVTIVYKFNWKKSAAIILVMWLIGMGLGLGIVKFTEPFRDKAQQTQTEDAGDNN